MLKKYAPFSAHKNTPTKRLSAPHPTPSARAPQSANHIFFAVWKKSRIFAFSFGIVLGILNVNDYGNKPY